MSVRQAIHRIWRVLDTPLIRYARFDRERARFEWLMREYAPWLNGAPPELQVLAHEGRSRHVRAERLREINDTLEAYGRTEQELSYVF